MRTQDAETIEVTASVVEPLGSDTLMFFEIAGLEMVARLPPDAVRQAGDRVSRKKRASRRGKGNGRPTAAASCFIIDDPARETSRQL